MRHGAAASAATFFLSLLSSRSPLLSLRLSSPVASLSCRLRVAGVRVSRVCCLLPVVFVSCRVVACVVSVRVLFASRGCGVDGGRSRSARPTQATLSSERTTAEQRTAQHTA